MDYAHLGGYSTHQPFVVYDRHEKDCPIGDRYYFQHIPRKLADAYWDTVQAQDSAFGIYEEDQFEEAEG